MNIVEQLNLVASGALVVIAKVTVLTVAAGCAALAARRAAAAARHFIWTLGLSGAVAIAAFSPAAPRIVIDVPVAAGTDLLPPAGRLTRLFSEFAPAPMRIPELQSAASVTSPAGVSPARIGRWLATTPAELAVIAWLVGCCIILARCVAGHAAVARLIKRGAGHPGDWCAVALQAAVERMHVSRPVRLVISDHVSTPMTSGWWRPVILLPRAALGWSAERAHVVMIHEVAHIARLDYLTQVVATIARALFWFHPAIWFAAGRLRAESEHAADDQVLAAGLPGTSYATHLLDLARHQRRLMLPAVAVGMARTSHLEGRLRAMLDTTRSRASVPLRSQLGMAAAALALMIPIAGLRTRLVAAPPSVATAAVTQEPMRSRASGNGTSPRFDREADSTIDRTVEARAGERLDIDLRTGGEIIVHAGGDRSVRLSARLAGENWRDTRVSLERSGNSVLLRSNYARELRNGSASHVFELWVPKRYDLHINSAGGSVTVRDLDGTMTGHTGGGQLDIQNVRGHLELATGGGDVRVADSELDGSVGTGGGTVEIVRVRGGLRGSSGSGPVMYGDAAGDESARRADRDITRGQSLTIASEREANAREERARKGEQQARAQEAQARANETQARRQEQAADQQARAEEAQARTNEIQARRQEQATEQQARAQEAQARRMERDRNPEGRSVTTFMEEPSLNRRSPDQSPDGLKGQLSISRAGGAVTVAQAPNGGQIHTGGGSITVGSSNGALTTITGGGDIELRNVAGSASSSTGAGNTVITVVNKDGKRAPYRSRLGLRLSDYRAARRFRRRVRRRDGLHEQLRPSHSHHQRLAARSR